MTIQSINAEILTGGFTNEQLSSIIDAVKFARARLGDRTKAGLRAGAKVRFTSNRSGQTITGTVRKVAIKNVIVDTSFGGYKVPASMLEVLEAV
jgi:hypothetical protein